MKRVLCPLLILALVLFSCPLALAVEEGDYTWEDQIISVTSIDTNPMFGPANMTEDQYPVAIGMVIPADLLSDEARFQSFVQQAVLVRDENTFYAPGGSASNEEESTVLLFYGIDQGVEVDSLSMRFGLAGGVPQEYVGQWTGHTGNISLSFTVEADGSGRYTFEQSGYVESYDFALAVESETFNVSIPTNNKLGIVTCTGKYAYSDDVLTLDVVTTFANGNEFSYTVPCQRTQASTEG